VEWGSCQNAKFRARLIERHQPLRDPISQSRPFDEFEDERVRADRVLEAIDRRDVRVVE
jgi:hypothetical protein